MVLTSVSVIRYSMRQKNVSNINTVSFLFVIFSQKPNGNRAQRRSNLFFVRFRSVPFRSVSFRSVSFGFVRMRGRSFCSSCAHTGDFLDSSEHQHSLLSCSVQLSNAQDSDTAKRQVSSYVIILLYLQSASVACSRALPPSSSPFAV